MTSWHSYPKVYNLGHAELDNLFQGDIIIQEKVDGSQFSFGLIDGELRFRSKGQEIYLGAVPAMFASAVNSVVARKDLLTPGYTYRGEVLSKPKHNALAYDRVPEGNVILFDINVDEERYLHTTAFVAEAERVGFETVPLLAAGPGAACDYDYIVGLLDNVSVLGGQKIEGVVIKNYSQFGHDKKVLMGKHVSEAFKEVHAGEWKAANPNPLDIIETLGQQYRTPARWQKAVQHRLEDGKLLNAPQDIGDRKSVV